MSLKIKGEAMYRKMKAEREKLVEKYEAGGTIRYDEAIGLIPMGGNPAVSTAPSAVGGALVANNGRRETRVPDYREDGALIGTRVVLDLATIKAANIADGIPSGTMMDALKKRAAGKTILLFPDDAALRYGTIILGEVPCQLKLMGDIVNAIRNAVFPGFQAANQTLNGVLNTGLAHALPGYVEQESLSHRGYYKPVNYRGDVEYLKDPVSIWATTDASRQPFMLFGVNSEVRMWGEGQVIDLSGFRLGAHERPNRVAAFSSIIDLADGHFAALSSKGARNAHIYSSNGKGRLARNNHFAIRGHLVKGLLVENVISGDKDTINHGSYFGTCVLNQSSEVCFVNVHQEMLNKAVANSSMALAHYAQLTNIEVLLGYFERPSTWETSGKFACPWMKWEPLAVGATDTFGNGKTTRLPVIKSEAELQVAVGTGNAAIAGLSAQAATEVREALLSMQAAYRMSMKSADDTYIQVNTGHNALNVVGANRAGLPMDSLQRMTDVKQIPRSANLIAQNPRVGEGFRYPDSVSYGLRAGAELEGTGTLATSRGSTIQDFYVKDCTFAGMHITAMEAPSIFVEGQGLMKTFNGMGLRMIGYSNSALDAAAVAPSLMLIDTDSFNFQVPKAGLVDKPLDSFQLAQKAVDNISDSTIKAGWTAAKAHGLFKGNDIVEAGLSAITAIGLLKKYYTQTVPKAQLSGVDNSNVDIGVLAWRKSMMTALGARTANHVGLKGGYQGDIFMDDGTYYGYGEIRPWFVGVDGTVKDHDTEIMPQAAARTDRRQTVGYVAAELPEISDSLWKFKLETGGAETFLKLVTADSETPVTYEQCAAVLGFGSGTGPVVYKITPGVDGQNHIYKASAFGVRFDEASRVVVENVEIKDFESIDAKKPAEYLADAIELVNYGIASKDHPKLPMLDLIGVSLSGVTEAHVEDVVVEKLVSSGSAFGGLVGGKSSDITIENFRCEDLRTGAPGVFASPFGEQDAVGVKVLKGANSVKLSKIKAEDFDGDQHWNSKVVDIESEEVELK